MGFCGFLQQFAVSCGFLRKSALPKCCNFQGKRKSAKTSENLRKTANLAPSLLIPLGFANGGLMSTIVHDCLRLRHFATKVPLRKGPKKATKVHNC